MARLCRAPDRRIRVLTGLGGSGKTTMVLAVAEQVASDGVRVWWLTVRSRQALTADLLDLLVDLPALHSLAAGLRRDLDADEGVNGATSASRL